MHDDGLGGLLRRLLFGDRHWCTLLLTREGTDGGLETQLELRLRSANEGLEDLRLGGVERDVAAGRVGEALEDDRLLGLDIEKVAELGESR